MTATSFFSLKKTVKWFLRQHSEKGIYPQVNKKSRHFCLKEIMDESL